SSRTRPALTSTTATFVIARSARALEGSPAELAHASVDGSAASAKRLRNIDLEAFRTTLPSAPTRTGLPSGYTCVMREGFRRRAALGRTREGHRLWLSAVITSPF